MSRIGRKSILGVLRNAVHLISAFVGTTGEERQYAENGCPVEIALGGRYKIDLRK
jgi:hypothetical protein